jgi:hypothetical protein
MNDYIANSKNRKLKKHILRFFDRINFGAQKLPISGRFILFLVCILGISLVFPWFHFRYSDGHVTSVFAFSSYTGYIGYGLLLSLIAIPFFLLSHAKKERIRAHVPFRLSDTQAVVFIDSLVLVSLFHLFTISGVFYQFVLELEVGSGFLMALSATLCILVSAFFLSKSTKEQSIEMRYLDHQEVDPMADYRSILSQGKEKQKEDEKNMSLPI